MYLSIGGDMAVRLRSVVGIFDLDNTTGSARTRGFLRRAERDGQTVAAGEELPKSFVLTSEFGMDRVYFSQFGPATLEKRASEGVNQGSLGSLPEGAEGPEDGENPTKNDSISVRSMINEQSQERFERAGL